MPGLLVISEQDILGNRLYRQRKYNKKIKNPLQNFSEINIGDLVVHIDHGIGKYTGFKSIFAAKIPHDCLIIEYAGGDKLFLPIEIKHPLSTSTLLYSFNIISAFQILIFISKSDKTI